MLTKHTVFTLTRRQTSSTTPRSRPSLSFSSVSGYVAYKLSVSPCPSADTYASRVLPGVLSRLPSSPTPHLLLSPPTRAPGMNMALSLSKHSMGSQTLRGQSKMARMSTLVVAPNSSFPVLPHTRARTTSPNSPRRDTLSASTRPPSSLFPTTRRRSVSFASPTCPSG